MDGDGPEGSDNISPARRAIGSRIKDAIQRRSLSQNALARHFGKVPSATNGWTTGRTQPSLEELAEICRLTGASADWLLGVPKAAAPPPRGINPRTVERAIAKLRGVADVVRDLRAELDDAKR